MNAILQKSKESPPKNKPLLMYCIPQLSMSQTLIGGRGAVDLVAKKHNTDVGVITGSGRAKKTEGT